MVLCLEQNCVLHFYKPSRSSLSLVNWHNCLLSAGELFCKFHKGISDMSSLKWDPRALHAGAAELVIWFVMNIPLTSLTNGYTTHDHVLCPTGKQIVFP